MDHKFIYQQTIIGVLALVILHALVFLFTPSTIFDLTLKEGNNNIRTVYILNRPTSSPILVKAGSEKIHQEDPEKVIIYDDFSRIARSHNGPPTSQDIINNIRAILFTQFTTLETISGDTISVESDHVKLHGHMGFWDHENRVFYINTEGEINPGTPNK